MLELSVAAPRDDQHGLDLVASGALLDRLALPPGIEAARCGDLALRGKEASVAAYSLTLMRAGTG